MNSSMIVTEPLPAAAWAEIGWAGREMLGDVAHAYMYAQRTADDRIALGGRGVPYRFGSRHRPRRPHPAARRSPRCTRLAATAVPGRRGASPIDARLVAACSACRATGAPTVGLDRATGLGLGRRLRRHRRGDDEPGRPHAARPGRSARPTELTALPWVGHRVRRWEPEPLRWLGVHGLYAAYRAADRAEQRGRPTTSPLARIADAVSGRH